MISYYFIFIPQYFRKKIEEFLFFEKNLYISNVKIFEIL